jgi:preprotein translocase subunit YajC
MIDNAYAMAAPVGQSGGNVNMIMNFAPIVLILGVFYFLLIRPQQKKAKEHQTMLDNLKKGDAVITNGGIYGKVMALTDQAITLEIADKVRIRVSRSAIAGLASSGAEQNS